MTELTEDFFFIFNKVGFRSRTNMLLDEIQRSQTSETERCEGICITPMQFQALKKVSFLQEHHVVVEYNLDGMLKILLPTNLQILFFFNFTLLSTYASNSNFGAYCSFRLSHLVNELDLWIRIPQTQKDKL